MSNEQKQKYYEIKYLKKYYEKYYAEKKLSNKK